MHLDNSKSYRVGPFRAPQGLIITIFLCLAMFASLLPLCFRFHPPLSILGISVGSQIHISPSQSTPINTHPPPDPTLSQHPHPTPIRVQTDRRTDAMSIDGRISSVKSQVKLRPHLAPERGTTACTPGPLVCINPSRNPCVTERLLVRAVLYVCIVYSAVAYF